jgi:hypothetical protein
MTSTHARASALLVAVVACISAVALAHAGHGQAVSTIPLAEAAVGVFGDTSVPDAGAALQGVADSTAEAPSSF